MNIPYGAMAAALPRLWHDRVKIVGVKEVKTGAFTDTVDVVIADDEPAKVSLKSLKASDQKQFGTDQYDVVMYIRTGLKMPAGCDVYVTDINGQTIKYKQTGRAYTGYVTHQEVAMIRDEKAKEES
ncbi:hypothetical protein [Secundilactobacillus muriivasis]